MEGFVALLLVLGLVSAAPPQPWGDSEGRVRDKRRDPPVVGALESQGVLLRSARDAALAPAEPEKPAESVRVKKNPNLPCGRSECGPLLSAQGPGAPDLEFQRSAELAERLAYPRTVDYAYAPVSLAYSQAGAPAAISTPSYGHSIFTPGAAAAVQPVHVETVPLLQPSLLRHPLMNHQLDLSLNLQRLHDAYYPGLAQLRRPVYLVDQPIYDDELESARSPLVCQPYKAYKEANQKSVNATSKSERQDEAKMREHLGRVSDIRDEIVRLNAAAQKIVDQQESLARMQAAHMRTEPSVEPPLYGRQYGMPYGYGGMPAMSGMSGMSGMSASQAGASSMSSTHGNSAYGQLPFPYTRSNAGNYPQTEQDVQFFTSMLNALKQLGAAQGKSSEELFKDLLQGQNQPQHSPPPSAASSDSKTTQQPSSSNTSS